MDMITGAAERTMAAQPAGDQKTLYFNLEPEAEVAVLGRMLYREGYNNHNWGHITYIQPDGTILLNPWEVPWDELRASDILRIDEEGNLLQGSWTVTPAVALHLAAHRLRPDVKVALHHHSEWGTVWSGLGEVPGVYHQNGAQIPGEIAYYDEYEDIVAHRKVAEANVTAMGDSQVAILHNHGVFVVAESIQRAHVLAVTLEQRARMAWRIKALGADKGAPMREDAVASLVKASRQGLSGPRFYHAMIRREVLADPSVLT
jgi:ribulose-5-phosphate 4-epimerase/fuculose-1-phosphate aldolase